VSFFGRKRDAVTACAFSSATLECDVLKTANQLRVRRTGSRPIDISLGRPAPSGGVRSVGILPAINGVECRAARALEEGLLGADMGQDAHAQQHEQMPY
jgi:hypothetical protein